MNYSIIYYKYYVLDAIQEFNSKCQDSNIQKFQSFKNSKCQKQELKFPKGAEHTLLSTLSNFKFPKEYN